MENRVISQMEKKKPYEELFKRIDNALHQINDKTQSFQVDYPIKKEEVVSGSEMENRIRKLVDFAEYINSKLPF